MFLDLHIFRYRCFSLFKNDSIIGFGILVDGFYKLRLNVKLSESLLTVYHNTETRIFTYKEVDGNHLKVDEKPKYQ